MQIDTIKLYQFVSYFYLKIFLRLLFIQVLRNMKSFAQMRTFGTLSRNFQSSHFPILQFLKSTMKKII